MKYVATNICHVIVYAMINVKEGKKQVKNLKFRAWDYDTNKMIFFNGIFNKHVYTETSTFSQYESIPKYHHLDIMQYTGLNDKNGREIYEGDFIKHTSLHDQLGVINFGTHEVMSHDYGCNGRAHGWHLQYEDRTTYALNNPFNTTSRNIEIVGNIYENPELIEINNEEE